MERDFTLNIYQKLIEEFISQKYSFVTFGKYLYAAPINKVVIIRHDVDRMPHNAKLLAALENKIGLTASYFFRYPYTFNRNIIKDINNLGHEIGYHYETLAKTKGNYAKALYLFEKELGEFRKITDVKTIAAHGSPLSKYDNKQLWGKYDFKKFGITGEPYLSINFNEILYLTDTGRSWNKAKVNIRDTVNTKFNRQFGSTGDLIAALRKGEFPDKIMLNIHPNRWNNNWIKWSMEFAGQNIKNLVKSRILKK